MLYWSTFLLVDQICQTSLLFWLDSFDNLGQASYYSHKNTDIRLMMLNKTRVKTVPQYKMRVVKLLLGALIPSALKKLQNLTKCNKTLQNLIISTINFPPTLPYFCQNHKGSFGMAASLFYSHNNHQGQGWYFTLYDFSEVVTRCILFDQ